MGVLSPEEYRDYQQRALGTAGARAEAERARIDTDPEQADSFGEQFMADLRTHNSVVNALAIAGRPVYTPEKGFDARQHQGHYSKFRSQFPELDSARSMAELASIKNRIDQQLKDRETVQQMGFGRSLAVGLTSGALDPVNYIPIGGALRAAGIGVRGANTLGKRQIAQGVRREAAGAIQSSLVVGSEAALGEALSQAVIRQNQGFQTVEDSAREILGAGLFGSLLGGVGGAIGSSRRKAMKTLIGSETLEEAIETTEQGVRRHFTENAEAKAKLNTLLDQVREKVDIPDADPARGLLLEAIESANPNLAKLMKLNGPVGRFAVRALFSPASRLATARTKEGRLFGSVITKHFLQEDGFTGPSVESLLGLAEIGSFQLRQGMKDIYDELPTRVVDEQQFFEMVGFAAVRGDQVNDTPSIRGGAEFDPFAELRQDPRAIDAVNRAAQENRKFLQLIEGVAERVGGMTKSRGRAVQAQQILSQIDPSFLPRQVVQEVATVKRPEFRQALRGALDERREQLMPEFEAELNEAKGLLAAAKELEDEFEIDFFEKQIKEYEEEMRRLENPDDFENLVFSIEENYTAPPSQPSTAPQSPLRRRVLQIDERHIEEYLVRDVRAIQSRLIRSVLPDLMLADQWDRHLGGKRSQVAALGQEVDKLGQRVEGISEFGVVDDAAANSVLRDMEDTLDSSQELTLSQQLRLIRSTKKAGVDDIVAKQDEIHEAFKIRKAERRKRAKLQEEIDEIEFVRRQLKAEGAPDVRLRALSDDISRVKAQIAASDEITKAVTDPLNDLARRIGEQVGESTASRALTESGLRVRANRLSLGKAVGEENLVRRIESLHRYVEAQAQEARRRTFALNVDTEHLKRAIERGYERDFVEVKDIGKRAKLNKAMRQETDAIDIEIARLRNRHGVGAGGQALGKAGKRLRDFNYLTKMGGVLLSSLPDVAMAISTAGFRNYAAALKEFLPTMFGGGNRQVMQEWMIAAEKVMEIERHRKLLGIDDDIVPGFDTRFDNAMDGATRAFTKLTMLDRWNAMNKAVAYQAIESRTTKTLLSPRPTRADVAMLDAIGVSETDRASLKKVLELKHSNQGGLRLANTGDWRDIPGFDNSELSRLRVTYEAAIFKGVNDTIITPSVGDLPGWATSHPLGRMLIQFRGFAVSATQRFLIPGFQRVAGAGDPGPAMAMAGLTMMGMTVYSLNELMRGRDPFRSTEDEDGKEHGPFGRLIIEGVDRGGGLGVLTEATASLVKGLGIGTTSRFQSRNQVDALLGPSLGTLKDIQQLAGAPFRDEFTSSDAARARRLVPYQNLLMLRLMLDVGPNLPNAGSREYFDRFRTIDQRIGGFPAKGE